MDPYDLTVVIPTHNAEDTIGTLTSTLLGIDEIAIQLILVDDASTDATPTLLHELAASRENVLAIVHDTNRGAGIARNTGFQHAQGRYTLFFDDDDEVHTDVLLGGIADLDDGGQDLALFKYRYRRDLNDAQIAMTNYDVELWDRYVGSAPSRTVRLNEAPDLLALTNYPWNKLMRTATYRASGLAFGSTPVNNDILGHWHALLFADRILLASRELCTHIVLAGGTNLTNRNSADRLSLFDALDETYDLLEANPWARNRYSHIYWSSVLRVAGWAASRGDEAIRERFESRLQDHLLRISLADFYRIGVRRSPSLAHNIVRKALG